jgi:hypothetical protein
MCSIPTSRIIRLIDICSDPQNFKTSSITGQGCSTQHHKQSNLQPMHKRVPSGSIFKRKNGFGNSGEVGRDRNCHGVLASSVLTESSACAAHKRNGLARFISGIFRVDSPGKSFVLAATVANVEANGDKDRVPAFITGVRIENVAWHLRSVSVHAAKETKKQEKKPVERQ